MIKRTDTFIRVFFLLLQLKDLIKFLYVVFFVVFGVGIYFHANLWTDDQSIWSGDWTDWRIWTIIYYPYWQLYGEMNLGILEGKKKCSICFFYISTHTRLCILFTIFGRTNILVYFYIRKR